MNQLNNAQGAAGLVPPPPLAVQLHPFRYTELTVAPGKYRAFNAGGPNHSGQIKLKRPAKASEVAKLCALLAHVPRDLVDESNVQIVARAHQDANVVIPPWVHAKLAHHGKPIKRIYPDSYNVLGLVFESVSDLRDYIELHPNAVSDYNHPLHMPAPTVVVAAPHAAAPNVVAAGSPPRRGIVRRLADFFSP